MKELILIICATYVIFSCSTNKNILSTDYPQKWALYKMTGQLVNSEASGDDMAWQEYYILESGGTFIKHRTQNGVQSEGVGVYSYVKRGDGKYLELVHKTESEVIGGCTTDKTETLWVKDNVLYGT